MRRSICSLSAVLFAALAVSGEGISARRFASGVTVDGSLDEWANAPQLTLMKPDVPDLGCDFAAVGWSDDALLFAFAARDTKIVNTNDFANVARGDNVEFRFCASESDRRRVIRLRIAPTSAAGKSVMTLHAGSGKNMKELASATDGAAANGVVWALKTTPKGWSIEASVPCALVGVKPSVGMRLPLVAVLWDRDRTDRDEWNPWNKRMESFSQKKPPSDWPAMTLADETAVAVRRPKNALSALRHDPCNMFAPDEDVVLSFASKLPAGATGLVRVEVTDAYGTPRFSHTRGFEPTEGVLAIRLGKLPRGYYEAQVDCSLVDANGASVAADARATFGVMEQPKRDLATFMREGRRFGIKWWGGVSDAEECKRLVVALGLNWSRAIFREAVQITTNADINAIVKIERFPKELYDEATYGPMAEWEKKFGRGGWTLKTLPKESEYRAYLREQIASIPAGRNVFEIWNEPWDKLNPADFSKLSSWIAEELRKVRPGAILGPNLKGDSSKYGYDAKVIEAGGMKGMDMVCLHPYSTCENRQWLRDYKAWISEKCGKPIDVYITEYGAHSCPQGPSRRTEREQAAMTVRQSLCLYAEDCKALVPHWMGQSERNPTYHEDWFGFVRKNLQPKPVLLALANCARLVDASEYRGDLWFGPGLAAMLFAKEGQTALALYGRGEPKEFALSLPAAKLTLVDTYGAAREIAATNGVFRVRVGDEPVYLTGLPADLKGDKALRADRFPPPPKPPRNVRRVAKMVKRPVFDGKLDDWTGAFQVAIQNEKVNGDDASGFGFLAWDDAFLYVAVDMRDNEMLNTKPRAKLYQHDGLELFVSTEPRETNAGYGPNDYQFLVTPTSGEGKPICGWAADRAAGVVTDVAGAKLSVGKTGRGWTLECAIPWSALGGYKPTLGGRIAVEPHVNDADTSHERWKLDPLDGNVRPEDPTVWSILEFVE